MTHRNRYLALLAGLIIIGAGSFYWNRTLPGIEKDRWQAVFLSDGQVYFGRLRDYNREYAVLKNVYYLKFSDGLQQKASEGAALSSRNLNLIKLGGEAHGPEGEMYLSKKHVMFFENLKPDSTVAQAILSNQR